MKILKCLCFVIVSNFLFTSCNKDKVIAKPDEELIKKDTLSIYKPKEFGNMDFNQASSVWSNKRSRHSEHFVVYWGLGYGTHDPNSQEIPVTHRVDIDDLLKKAEEFYKLNIEQLKFAERGVGKSNLDKYKMMIFVHYTTEWMAFGGGYDDVIGALWISPNTVQPVGSTVAHEIGHSFQYQVRCDLGASHGFRYGFGGNGGNAFWEQTAQWQAMQSYPEQNFSTHHFSVYTENYHRHQVHELYRYANYFIHHYWVDKHGVDIIGRVWRESTSPEDPIQAYMRITKCDVEQLNAEIYDMAAKFSTWDIGSLRTLGRDYIGRHQYGFDLQSNRALRVDYNHCPGTTGYNVVPLDVPEAGKTIEVDFKGLVDANNFNPIANSARAGWRYGFVALSSSGVRTYSPMYKDRESKVSFVVPSGSEKLYFIVTGAPSSYAVQAWDDKESNDEQWPYEIRVNGTQVSGYVSFEEGQQPLDVTLEYNLDLPFDNTDYGAKTIHIDQTALAKAFVLQPSAIKSSIGNKVKFYAVEKNGGLNPTTTANGLGHWFDSDGNTTVWGENARLFSEFSPDAMTFRVGQYPNRLTVGNKYTLKQALVYEYETGKTAQATFQFNITVK